MAKQSLLNADEAAVVIDNHTGRVRAHFLGFGAEKDAASFVRGCQGGRDPKSRVDFLSSVSVVIGEKARKAIKVGKV